MTKTCEQENLNQQLFWRWLQAIEQCWKEVSDSTIADRQHLDSISQHHSIRTPCSHRQHTVSDCLKLNSRLQIDCYFAACSTLARSSECIALGVCRLNSLHWGIYTSYTCAIHTVYSSIEPYCRFCAFCVCWRIQCVLLDYSILYCI